MKNIKIQYKEQMMLRRELFREEEVGHDNGKQASENGGLQHFNESAKA